MGAGRGVQLIQLGLAGQPHLHHEGAHAAQQVGRIVRRELPGGYIWTLASTPTSISPARRNSSGTRRPTLESAPLRLKATGKISQIRVNAGCGG